MKHSGWNAFKSADHFKGGIERFAAMYDYRQINLSGETHLSIEHLHLFVKARFVPIEIHAYFTDGNVTSGYCLIVDNCESRLGIIT